MNRFSTIIKPAIASNAVDHPVLDEESQALAIQASMECHSEIVAMTEDMNRMEDTAMGLENLAMVADQIQGATKTEMALVDIAGDLAFAGTGVSGAVMTPGLEDCEGEVVSTEGIKTIANDIWKAIKDFVKKMWRKVDEFFHKIFGTLPRLRKALVALKDRADKMSDKSIDESKTEVGSAANAVAVAFNAPGNAKALEDTLTTTRDVVNALFDTYTKCVITRGEAIKKGLKDYKPTKEWKASQHETALAKVHSYEGDHSKIVKAFDADELKIADRRFADGVKIHHVQLPGNMSLFLQGADTATDGSTALGKAERARTRTVRVMGTFEKSKDAIDEHEIDTLTVSEIKAIADQCIDIVDGIEAWERGKNIGKVKDLVKDIEGSGDVLKKAEDKLDDVSSELRSYPKSAMGFVKSYSMWAAEPHTAVTNTALAAVRASIVVCNKSLSNYK